MEKYTKIWQKLVDLFLPRLAEVRELEEISAFKLWRKARKSEKGFEENILALFSYRDPLIRTAIWQIKYKNNSKITRLLATLLYERLIDELGELSQFANFNSPILVPIPMSEARRKVRGYNQTENLAKEIMRIDNGRTFELRTDIILKIKETEPQSSLTRALRLQNLKGCFKVTDPVEIRARNLILIDDVTTTGSTIRQCRETLLNGGASKVIAITIAH